MNSTPLILLAVGLATGASVATTYALRPAPPVNASEGLAQGDELSNLRQELAEVRSELATLRASRNAGDLPLATSSQRIDTDEIERAVRRYMDQLKGGEALASVQGTDESAASAKGELDVKDLLAQLDDPDLTEGKWEAVWKQIREAGLLEEAIALFEGQAEANPNDPDAQVDVAKAYLQKIFEVGEGPEAGLWAGKADAAFDRALDLNPRHWEARFNKAISLSFWPPIFGKQAEAISNFETLITQQADGPQEEYHAQSYLLLGNLYTQTGQVDKAKEIWSQGLAAFPGNESLAGKLGN